jgi:hypothetical protein
MEKDRNLPPAPAERFQDPANVGNQSLAGAQR